MSGDPARVAELRAFDATKAGVKGLVDAGFTSIPGFFVHPDREQRPIQKHEPRDPAPPISIPVVDLAPARSQGPGRRHAAGAVARAAETLGHFYVANHGVAHQVLDEMLERVRGFNEVGVEVRRDYYNRDPSKKVRYYSNFDLFQAPAANWRVSLFFWMSPDPPRPEELPIACREVTFEYSNHVGQLGKLLFELLFESLGSSLRLSRRDGVCERACSCRELLPTVRAQSHISLSEQASIPTRTSLPSLYKISWAACKFFISNSGLMLLLSQVLC